MPNYAVSVSGFQNTAAALDTVSNNIANANTVGYKAGEYVFADQFAKVTDWFLQATAWLVQLNLAKLQHLMSLVVL